MMILIRYNEVDQSSYQGIELMGPGEARRQWNTGEPEVDFMQCSRWIILASGIDLEREPVSYSSSLDHFVMDGDGYKWFNYLGMGFLLRMDRTFEEVLALAKAAIPTETLKTKEAPAEAETPQEPGSG